MRVIDKRKSCWIYVILMGTLMLFLFTGLYIWHRQRKVEEPREYDGIFVWVGGEE